MPFIEGYYNISKPRRTGVGGGVAIYIKKNLISKEQKTKAGRIEIIRTKIRIGNEEWNIGSIYIPPKLTQKEMMRIHDIPTKDERILIGGDFNIGIEGTQKKTKMNKKILEDWISENGLSICGRSEPTTRKAESAIDYFLQRGLRIKEVSQLETMIPTDHKAIKLKIYRPKEREEKRDSRFNFKRIDQISYVESLESDYLQIPEMKNSEELTEAVENLILKNLQENCPKKKLFWTKERTGTPWWNHDITKKIKERNYLRRRLVSEHQSSTTKNLLASANKELKKMIKEAKAEFQERVNDDRSMCDYHRIVKSILKTSKGKKSESKRITGLKVRGEKIIERKQIAQCLQDHFSKVGEKRRDEYPEKEFRESEYWKKIEKRIFKSDDYHSMNKSIKRKEIERMLDGIKKNKAPGLDKIEPFALKKGNCAMKRILYDLYNKVWESDYPKKWNLGTIIPIQKNKKEFPQPEEFRPISLLSVLSKGMEKIVLNRLKEINRSNEIIPENQRGFKKGYSTIENCVILHDMAHEAITNKKIFAVAFMDLSKAYDRVQREKLIKIVAKYGIEGKMLNYLREVLGKRQSTTKFEEVESEVREMNHGVVQGSALSPELFSMYIAELTRNKPNVMAYADDLIIYITGKEFQEVERRLNKELAKINEEAKEINMEFSAEKTKIVLFTNKRKKGRQMNFQLNGKTIEIRKNWKYLGIIWDEHLTFKEEIEERAKKAKMKYNMFKFVSHKLFGANTRTLINIYSTHIRSLLEYGSEVWGSATESNLRKIDTIEQWCLTRALGISIRAKKEDVLNSCNITPIDERRKERLMKFWEKKRRNTKEVVEKIKPQHKQNNRKRAILRRINEWENQTDEDLRRIRTRNKELPARIRERKETEEEIAMKQMNIAEKLRIIRKDKLNKWGTSQNKITCDMAKILGQGFCALKTRAKRREEIVRNQLIFGTLPLGDLQFRLKQRPTSTCPFCAEEKETSFHLAFECARYSDLRLKTFNLKSTRNRDEIRRIISSTEPKKIHLYIKLALKRRRTKA